MQNFLNGNWSNTIVSVSNFSYVCGYCGTNSGPSKGYDCSSQLRQNGTTKTTKHGGVYICPQCNKPTFITQTGEKVQVPGPKLGDDIEFLPLDIEQLYNEARSCVSVNAYTASILSCRKLLMNTAVSKGAQVGKSFAYYVNFLSDKHFIPPGSDEWVDHIRNKGNEATHEIPSMSKDDAIELLDFTEMLLRFVYEMPGKMAKHKSLK